MVDNATEIRNLTAQVERQLSQNFAGILDDSGIDYRVVVLVDMVLVEAYPRLCARMAPCDAVWRAGICVRRPLATALMTTWTGGVIVCLKRRREQIGLPTFLCSSGTGGRLVSFSRHSMGQSDLLRCVP